MSKVYVFEVENEKGEVETQYVTLTDEKIDWIVRSYIERRVNAGLPV